MSQYITVCVVHSSVLAWISSVHIDKVIAWLRFRKICVLKASFSKNLLQIQGRSWIFVTGRHYRDCRRHESCRGFWGYSPPPPKFSNLEGPNCYFQYLLWDMSPKNRPRISALFWGPIKLKHTVYPRTSSLNILQYYVMKPIKKCLQFDFRSSGVCSWFHDE